MSKETLEIIRELARELPSFPDGRIDYTNAKICPVVTVFIKHKDEILLLKRSDKVTAYKGKWATVGGYIDEVKEVKEKVLEELREELGVLPSQIEHLHIASPYESKDPNIGVTWLVHPAIAVVKEKPVINLDWEHTESRWIKPHEMNSFDILNELDESLWRVLDLEESAGAKLQ